MPHIAILMYHRICPQTKYSQCYFARGTAVEPEVFKLQLDWLNLNYTFVSLKEAVEIARKKIDGKYCVLTFDDGYIEIKDIVWPLCKQLQIPISIFPIAGHTAEAKNPVYIDHYYAILHYAKNRLAFDLKFLDVDLQAPAIDKNLQWWIMGPFKQKLHQASIREQLILLEHLAQCLDSQIPKDLPKKLYLSKSDIAGLYTDGVEVGGHGYHHRRLGEANDKELEFEIVKSQKLLQDVGILKPNLFCYPDGSHSDKVEKYLQNHGFTIACTVKKGIYSSGISPLKLPRVFMRNVKPTQELWPICL